MNRRQFLTRIPMIGAAIVAAPAVAAALTVRPEFAMGGTLTPGTPYMVGESVGCPILTPDQVRAMEDAWERRYVGYDGALRSDSYVINFNPAALLRGDAQPHKA